METRHPRVANVENVEATSRSRGSRYAFERRQLGSATGSTGLGCSHMTLPSGKSAWPRHWHAANHEAYFVLRGRGTVTLGERDVSVRAGDWVALPPGPDGAHRITNTGEEDLEYLALSTMIPTDVTFYPSSGKVGVFAGSAPGGAKEDRLLSGFFPVETRVDYWAGEDVDE